MHKRRASTFFTHLMCSPESRYWISKMASVLCTLIFFLFLYFATAAAGEMKKSVDKIIIHVPYKIHKHHHIHTKYKVITIPAPKKENTVIYLKEQIQPIIKEVPVAHTQVEITETQPNLPKTVYQAPEMIIPPHQESAQSFLKHISDQNNRNPTQTDQPKEYSTIADDQKSLETHSGHNLENFIPNLAYKPTLPTQTNFIPNFSLKPAAISSHPLFTPKFFINPGIHESYQHFLPKLSYQPMVHLQGHHFTSPYKFKPILPNPKPLQDNVAHTSSQLYKTIIPRPRATSYQVKEENQEGKAIQLVKHQPKSNATPVPSVKSKRKGKTYAHLGHNYQLKNFNKILPDANYEYEHVGYLIIDENSQKLVGKNFKDELFLSR